MRDSDWNNILYLLCIAILVDGKVYKEEVDAFLVRAKIMNDQISSGMFLTDKMLMDWFHAHRDQIEVELDTELRSTYLRRHIEAIKTKDITPPLLQCLYDISTADETFHETEVSLVYLAAKIWELPRPKAQA